MATNNSTRTFVWRAAAGEPYHAFSTKLWFEPFPEDPNCFWRGDSYPEALRQAKVANRIARTSPEAFQRPTIGQPLKRPNPHELASLHALAETGEQPAHRETRENLVKYGWASVTGEKISITREGQMVFYLSALALPAMVLGEAFPAGVPIGRADAASRLGEMLASI